MERAIAHVDQTPPSSPATAAGRTASSDDRLVWRALGRFVDRIAPWLLDAGIWIFGGLIAFDLLVLASLITVGPGSTAVMIAAAGFALALPLDLTGLFLLRLMKGLKGANFEDELAEAFQEVGYVSDQIPAPTAFDALRKRRLTVVMRTSAAILALSGLLTLVGVTATLWYMAWWIAVGFSVMVAAGCVVIVGALMGVEPPRG